MLIRAGIIAWAAILLGLTALSGCAMTDEQRQAMGRALQQVGQQEMRNAQPPPQQWPVTTDCTSTQDGGTTVQTHCTTN